MKHFGRSDSATFDPDFQRRFQDQRTNFQLAQQILTLRIRAGLSERELADMADTTEAAVAAIEEGSTDDRSFGEMRRIAAALGHRIDFVFTLVDNGREPIV